MLNYACICNLFFLRNFNYVFSFAKEKKLCKIMHKYIYIYNIFQLLHNHQILQLSPSCIENWNFSCIVQWDL